MKIEQKGLDKIKKIYNLFADNKSKYIFKNRLMFNLFDENEYIRNIIKTNRVAADFLDKLLNENDPVAVWGVGIRAHKFRLFYPEVEVMCYIDSNKHGETYNGIEIISFEEYLNRGLNTKIVILPRFSHKEIEHEIKQAGIKEHNILNFAKIMDYLYEVQYFDLPQIKEVKYFIDGGAYDGADTLKFAKNFRGGYHRFGNQISV